MCIAQFESFYVCTTNPFHCRYVAGDLTSTASAMKIDLFE